MSEKRPNHQPASDKLRIKVKNNGPYVVSGGIPLSVKIIVRDAEGIAYEWRDGKKYPLQESYKLCRCGQSNNKPFCDGSHRRVDFSGTETESKKPYLERAQEFPGPGLDLTDAKELCVHARFCDRAGGIWKLTEESSDPEAKKIAIEEARDCPSGRLVVWDKEGHPIEPALAPEIVLVEDPQRDTSGPIWVRGGIIIECADGTTYEVRNRVTLCRCGKSGNKALCDGTHFEK
jgi:CDGSH-type Zn-finger protein